MPNEKLASMVNDRDEEDAKALKDVTAKLIACQKRASDQHEALRALRTKQTTGEGALSQSSLEAYGGMLIGILLALLPMTWWLRLTLFIALCFLCVDFCWRSPFTFRWKKPFRTGLCLSAFAVLSWVGYGNVKKQYLADLLPPNLEYLTGYGSYGPVGQLVYHVGYPDEAPKIIGSKMELVTVDGRLLTKYATMYQLVAQVFHYDGLEDFLDVSHPSRSAPFDIADSDMSIPIPWNDRFIDELKARPVRNVYQLLLVPSGLSMEQFKTTREATKAGVIVLQSKERDQPLGIRR